MAEDARRLRGLIDSLPAMVSYWDRGLMNVVANTAFAEFVGLASGEIAGHHLREILGEDVYRSSRSRIAAVLAGERQVFERTLTDRRGHACHIDTTYVPDFDGDGVCGFYVQDVDVTKHIEVQHARDDAVRLLQISMHNAPIGQAITDTSLCALYVNPALCAMFGYDSDEVLGVNLRTFVHPDDVATAAADFDELKNTSCSHVTSELRLVRRDGATIWVQRNAVLVPGTHGSDDVIIGQFQDVTARKRAEAELARQAVTDSLTGVGNRQAFLNAVHQRRTADPAAPLGIIFIDLDGFKQINDEHGHVVGDAVLAEVAQRITQIVRTPDSAYRIGGDEFVVVSTQADGEDYMTWLAGQLKQALTGEYRTDTAAVALSTSVGSTWGPTDNFEQLLTDADTRMYRHKMQQRSQQPSTERGS